MKCTFYRPETINIPEFNRVMNDMKQVLNTLKTGTVSKEEISQYLRELLPQAEPFEAKPEMYFFGFADPRSMPSDSRVEYFYKPTYLAAAILIQASTLYPEILTDGSLQGMEPYMKGCLTGCTGRDFAGSGYESFRGLLETLNLFYDAGLGKFLKEHKNLCPVFTQKVIEIIQDLQLAYMAGPVIQDWETDFTFPVEELLVKAGAYPFEEPIEDKFYLAYGSNLNLERMYDRCPDAILIGTTDLKDHRLVFRKSGSGFYLSIDQAEGRNVPVAVWKVSKTAEKNLDRYEGFPRYYQKKEVTIKVKDALRTERTVEAFVYYLPEDRPAGLPTDAYMDICSDGYRDMHLDKRYLKEALKYTESIS